LNETQEKSKNANVVPRIQRCHGQPVAAGDSRYQHLV
jgi:hypothetical protein